VVGEERFGEERIGDQVFAESITPLLLFRTGRRDCRKRGC
jgi:hypothetical protein